MKTITLKIIGMHCRSCEAIIKEGLEELAGVRRAEPALLQGNVVVSFDEEKVSVPEIKAKIVEEGYRPR